MWKQQEYKEHITWGPLSELPLFNQMPDSIIHRVDHTAGGAKDALEYNKCSSCGENSFCGEKEGGFCLNCRTYQASPSEEKDFTDIENLPYVPLNIKYTAEWQQQGEILPLLLEDHGWYKIAVIEVKHKYPGKPYTHKWRALWPEGKRDGITTYTKKLSKGKTVSQKYRIHYASNDLGAPIFVYTWEKKDSKRVDLNNNCIRRVIQEMDPQGIVNETLQ